MHIIIGEISDSVLQLGYLFNTWEKWQFQNQSNMTCLGLTITDIYIKIIIYFAQLVLAVYKERKFKCNNKIL